MATNVLGPRIPKDAPVKNYGTEIKFSINGKTYTVKKDVPPDTTLNKFIRSYAKLPGTKHMCNEGGCGACVVSAQYCHPVTKQNVVVSVNSCLLLVYACHGWSIRTVEGIGNKKYGYNIVQTTLAHFNGTQCGYCSPGFVMNMYSLLERNANLTMEEIEKSFSGHICRCTGYRPILDAFKSLAVDATDQLRAKCADIEDIPRICVKKGIHCYGDCKLDKKQHDNYGCLRNGGFQSNDEIIANSFSDLQLVRIASNVNSDTIWYKVRTIKEIFDLFSVIPDNENYMLVAGNTAQGAYRNTRHIKHYIDIKDVSELRTYAMMDNSLHLGANITLSETIDLFKAMAIESPGLFSFLNTLADHIELVANVSVRNIGTIAGNLTLKHNHRDFPSDIFLILETVGAFLLIENGDDVSKMIPLDSYLNVVMHKKLISKLIIPSMKPDVSLKTFKIMPRAQNAPGILNAGFCLHADKENNYKVVSKPSVVIGGINHNLVHAENLEKYLIGKNVLDDAVLQEALKILDKEVMNYKNEQDASFEYKKILVEALFYRFVLGINPEGVEPRYRSGINQLERGLSKGSQEYSTDVTKWPINKPIPKIEALSQCAGEAEYVNDIPHYPHELQGALVLTKICKARIASINPSSALMMPGVVDFFSAKDIPGKNSFVAQNLFLDEEEEVFCSDQVQYAGQPVGIIVAETREIALKAAEKVEISYSDIVPPKLHLKNIAKSGDETMMMLTQVKKPEIPPPEAEVKQTLKGTVESPSQYHFTMEVQSCICVPQEGELFIYSATQWPTCVQEAISVALGIPECKINMSTKRLGGGYGCKISRASMIAVACSIASYCTQRPTRLVLDLESNMAAIGKRNNCYAEYEVGVDESGKIVSLEVVFYEDNGWNYNEPNSMIVAESLTNIYDSKHWSLKGFNVITNKASNTWTRAPGTIDAIIIIETIMEHIASALNKDSLEVRFANANQNGTEIILGMIGSIIESSDLKNRKERVQTFNKENRWKKRGIALIPMAFTNVLLGPSYALISVYAKDGSVTICHGGIEMGQGINTKVAQVVAAKLGVELDNVSVKATNSITSPNNIFTGAGTTTEMICKAALMACETLLEELHPLKAELGENFTWLELIKKAHEDRVNLVHVAQAIDFPGYKHTYKSYGAAVSEVEVDLLTGKHLIHRTDIIEDAGQSISPEIDIGQVEGAFIMGLGLLTSEELKYDEVTGELKTTRTWNYHPPGARDIPKDLRITLLKNVSNPEGVLGSKATGEPPLLLSTTVLFAIRDAVKSGREDSGNNEDWFEFHPPLTPEKIFLASLSSRDNFKLH